MKKFEMPSMDIMEFHVEDIVTASSFDEEPPIGGSVGGNCF